MATEFKLSYTASDINERLGRIDNLAKKSDIPTDYLTEIPAEYVTEAELTAKGYLTEHQSLTGYATETYVNDTVTNQIATKQDAITGTAGQFVVIGTNGKPTTKTILIAEEATF